MARIGTAIILAAVMWLTSVAQASQTDERLEGLFDRLKSTDSEVEAAAITQQIWFIWL